MVKITETGRSIMPESTSAPTATLSVMKTTTAVKSQLTTKMIITNPCVSATLPKRECVERADELVPLTSVVVTSKSHCRRGEKFWVESTATRLRMGSVSLVL
jgi:hypothetical protein